MQDNFLIWTCLFVYLIVALCPSHASCVWYDYILRTVFGARLGKYSSTGLSGYLSPYWNYYGCVLPSSFQSQDVPRKFNLRWDKQLWGFQIPNVYVVYQEDVPIACYLSNHTHQELLGLLFMFCHLLILVTQWLSSGSKVQTVVVTAAETI